MSKLPLTKSDEPGSRGNDWKTDEERQSGNSGGNVSDGKFEDTPQGGKRRGPEHPQVPLAPKD